MRSIARNLHALVAWILVAGLFVQVWLAGRGVFEPGAAFATHRDVGFTLSIGPIILLVLGLLGGSGRRAALLAAGIFVLFILQSVFVALKTSSPLIAALHPVNGFLILLASISLAWDSWRTRREPA